MIEGKEISLQCNTVSGTAPIMYKWERIEEDGKAGSLPPMAHISKSTVVPKPPLSKGSLVAAHYGSYQKQGMFLGLLLPTSIKS